MTHVADRSYYLSLAFATVALLLELLVITGHDLLLHSDMTLSFAPRTVFHIVRIISTLTSTVRTDDLAVVLELKIFAFIQFF